jgi:molybdate transport system ATP-binding protein
VLQLRIHKRLPDFSLDLSFEARNEILVLFGPSGSGKSMTLRVIAGLERPDEGEIRLNDRLLFSRAERVNLPPRERRCGLVFQNLALFPHLDVARNVQYGVRHPGPEAAQRLRRLLETFRIGHLSRRFPAAHRVWQIPFLLVTHDRAEAERLGDRILFLREGRQEPARG